MARHHIGVLAENDTDCDVIVTLADAILKERRKDRYVRGDYKFHCRASCGCAKLRRKAEPWMRELLACGCRHVILVHDADRSDPARLRAELESLACPRGIRRLICIPVEEIEAWFFASPKALRIVCGDQADRHVHRNPHLLPSPKEQLIRLSVGQNRKPRYSPNDNARLAAELELDLCSQRCPAFRELRQFLFELD